MRNAALHRRLEAFTVDASGRLSAEAAAGAEMPFELLEERGAGATSLYCYRPLTGAFIHAHRRLLHELPSHAPAMRALAECEALDAYLIQRDEGRLPPDRRGLAELALEAFLRAVFAERTEFGFEPAHFESAYAELERTVYEGHGTATVIAPVLGVALDPATTELTLGDGLSLIRGDALAGAPAEAVWGDGEEPNVVAVLAVDQQRADRPPIAVARARFRQILSALRLFERGGYALGPVAWARADNGPSARWHAVALGANGRPRVLTLVPTGQEEELRAFCRLVRRRRSDGELSWALARFEMGCERPDPLQALTDYLLALRALLEPEGPASGRLAQRLAVICGRPEDRAQLAQRAARAIALERSVITGLTIDAGAGQPSPRRGDRVDPGQPSLRRGDRVDPGQPSLRRGDRADPDAALVDELGEHLRAILRDALCGHLDADLCAVADGLLAEAATGAGGSVR